MRAYFALVWSSARIALRDPTVLVLLVASPFLFIAIAGRVFGAQAGYGRSPYGYSVPAISIFFLFFLVSVTVNMVYREVYWGTWTRIIGTFNRHVFVAAKLTAGWLVGLAQLLIVWVLTWPTYGFHGLLEPYILATGVVVSFVAAATGVLISAIGRTHERSLHLGNLVVLVLGACGGGLIPRSSLPSIAQSIGRISPESWTLNAIKDGILNHPIGWLENLSIIFTIAVVFAVLGISVIRFEKLRMS